MSLIHRYQSNGYNIVLDINSGCIHLVDEVTYEVLPYLEEGMEAYIRQVLQSTWNWLRTAFLQNLSEQAQL